MTDVREAATSGCSVAPVGQTRADSANGRGGRRSERQYQTLDAWRGIAALWVVLFHATAVWRRAPSTPAGIERVLDIFAEFGWLGVQLFFVISGYCIAATADSCRYRPSGAAVYGWRRLVRIFPTYAAWLLVVTGVLIVAEQLMPQASFWSRKDSLVPVSQMHPGEWLSNLFLVQTWLPQLTGLRSINVTEVAWTLCYEIQFYLIVGTIIAVAPKRLFGGCALVTALLALLFALLPTFGWSRAVGGTFLDGRWIQFATGIVVYYVVVYASRAERRSLLAMLLLTAAGCLWLGAGFLGADATTRDKREFEIGFCAAFAVVLVLLRPVDARLSSRRSVAVLCTVGVASYSLYLVHWPVCKVLSTAAWSGGQRSTVATWAITVPVCVAASLAAGGFWFWLVERRFLNAPLRSQPAEAAVGEVPQPAVS